MIDGKRGEGRTDGRAGGVGGGDGGETCKDEEARYDHDYY